MLPQAPVARQPAGIELPAGAEPEAAEHELTVVIPAHNEAERLPPTLARLRKFLNGWGVDYRVLVVDDGSRDGTREISARFGLRFSTLSLSRQSGKGAAVKHGMLHAKGRVVAFTDADLPCHLAALQVAHRLIRAGECRVVFGARDMMESAIRVQRSFARRLASFVFRCLMRITVAPDVPDTQCPLKVFSRRAAQEVFARTTIAGFAFDAEVVWLTRRLRLAYRRIPVTVVNDYASTVRLSRHVWRMLYDVARLRLRPGRRLVDPLSPGISQTRTLTGELERREAA